MIHLTFNQATTIIGYMELIFVKHPNIYFHLLLDIYYFAHYNKIVN
jgi:hypothetical protein